MNTTEIKTAAGNMVDEFRAMLVGERRFFPLDKYNYNSIRALQSTSLVPERVKGAKWRTSLNLEMKGMVVTRIS